MTTKTTFEQLLEPTAWAIASGVIGAAVVKGNYVFSFIPPSSYGFFPTAGAIAICFGVAKVVEHYASKKFGEFTGSVIAFFVQGGIIVGMVYFNILPLSVSPLCPVITGLFFFIYKSRIFHLKISELKQKPLKPIETKTTKSEEDPQQKIKIQNLEKEKKGLEVKLGISEDNLKKANEKVEKIGKELEELKRKKEETPKITENPQQKERIEKLEKEKSELQNQLVTALFKANSATQELEKVKKELELLKQSQSQKEEPKIPPQTISNPKDLVHIEQLKNEKLQLEQQSQQANQQLEKVRKELELLKQSQSQKEEPISTPKITENIHHEEHLKLIEQLKKENEELKRSKIQTEEQLIKEEKTEEIINHDLIKTKEENNKLKTGINNVIYDYDHGNIKGVSKSKIIIKRLKELITTQSSQISTLDLSQINLSHRRSSSISPKDKTSPKGEGENLDFPKTLKEEKSGTLKKEKSGFFGIKKKEKKEETPTTKDDFHLSTTPSSSNQKELNRRSASFVNPNPHPEVHFGNVTTPTIQFKLEKNPKKEKKTETEKPKEEEIN